MRKCHVEVHINQWRKWSALKCVFHVQSFWFCDVLIHMMIVVLLELLTMKSGKAYKKYTKKYKIVYRKIPKISPGAYIFQRLIFGGAYLWKEIDWASLIVGSKFTIVSLFHFVFERNFPSTSPRGAYIKRGDLKEGFLRYRIGGPIFGGAYTWRGLFSEFHGIWRRYINCRAKIICRQMYGATCLTTQGCPLMSMLHFCFLGRGGGIQRETSDGSSSGIWRICLWIRHSTGGSRAYCTHLWCKFTECYFELFLFLEHTR